MSISELRQDIINGLTDDVLIKKYKANVMIELCEDLEIASSITTKDRIIIRLKKKLLGEPEKPKAKGKEKEKKEPSPKAKQKTPPSKQIYEEIRILSEVPIGQEQAFIDSEGKKYTLTKLGLICRELDIKPRMQCRTDKTGKEKLFRLLINEARTKKVPKVLKKKEKKEKEGKRCGYPDPICPDDMVCDLDRNMCLSTVKDVRGKQYVGNKESIDKLLSNLEFQRMEEERKEVDKVATPIREVGRKMKEAEEYKQNAIEAVEEFQHAKIKEKQALDDVKSYIGSPLEKSAKNALVKAQEKTRSVEKKAKQAIKEAENKENEAKVIPPTGILMFELQSKGIDTKESCDPSRDLKCSGEKICNLDLKTCFNSDEPESKSEYSIVHDKQKYIGSQDALNRCKQIFDIQSKEKRPREKELDIAAIVKSLKTIRTTSLKSQDPMDRIQGEIDKCLGLK